MRKHYSVIALICLILSGTRSLAQMSGDCIFLQAAHLEIGISPLGSFGAPLAAPTGYHPNGTFSSLYDPGTGTAGPGTGILGFVADPAEDGWAVGTPPYFGDYFLPGDPQEGWSIQVNGVQSDAWTPAMLSPGGGFTGTLSGGNTSYTNTGGVATAVWKGQTTDTLLITQTVTLDTNKLYFIVHVKIKNIMSTTATAVYYQRTLDPDNTEPEYGSFVTNNSIVYQLPDAGNKVMVSAVSTYDSTAFLGLGTKDCRAVCFIIAASLTTSPNTLDVLWGGTASGYYYTAGSYYSADVGIGLVYNLGDIRAGDSTDLTYAYILRAADLDSALEFTSPTAVVNSTILHSGADTVSACTLLTDSLPVSISNGEFYTWLWAPTIGLSSDTGTFNYVFTDSLSTITTYTVIGTPRSGSVCSNDTFHFSVLPGISPAPRVTNVSYCQYATPDSLRAVGVKLRWYTTPTGGVGDTVAPVPSTTVPGIFTYYVTQHIGACGVSPRAVLTVTVVPQPAITASSNSPVCQYHTLNLIGTDTITSPVIYSWVGPDTFASRSKDTFIYNVPLAASGNYTVSVNRSGCIATSVVAVTILPTPIITSVTETNPTGCRIPDGTITLYGLNPDSTYLVSFDTAGTTATVTITADSSGHVTLTGLLAYYYSQIMVRAGDGCWSPMVSTVLTDPGAPAPPMVSNSGPVCTDSTLYLYASDTTTGITYNWTYPDGTQHSIQNPVITNVTISYNGIYDIYFITPTGCHSRDTTMNVIVNPTPPVPVIPIDSVCAGVASALVLYVNNAVPGETFTWVGPMGYSSAGGGAISISPADTGNTGVYTVVGTSNGCPSSPGTGIGIVHPIPPAPYAADTTYCQYDVAVALTASGDDLWYATPTTTTSSIYAPVPATTTPGEQDFYVSQLVLGCESPKTTIVVTTKPKPNVGIRPRSSSVCIGDTLSFTFLGTAFTGETYLWTIPASAVIDSGSDSVAGPIVVTFDSSGTNRVSLTVSLNGCTTSNHYNVDVIPTPLTGLYLTPSACVGDTVTISLTTASALIDSFQWNTDSTHLHIISAGSTGGGPFGVSWDTVGSYVVSVMAFSSQDVCPSLRAHDTITIHPLPDATFTGTPISCTGDSVLFTANTSITADSYTWGPASFFSGVLNTPTIYGVVLSAGYVSLTVTDPFGCTITDSLSYDPSSCCMITFPSAFTPGGIINTRFRPITLGHHTLSDFRIANRWGVTVYETTTSTSTRDATGWDGNYGGVPQDMGTYYYYIKFTCDGHDVEQTGSVTLVR